MTDLTPVFEEYVRRVMDHIERMRNDWDGGDPEAMRDIISFAIRSALHNGVRLANELTMQRVIRLESRIQQLEQALQDIVDEIGPTAGCGECCVGCQAEMTEALRISRAALTPPGPQG
jgi:hypothetical protein